LIGQLREAVNGRATVEHVRSGDRQVTCNIFGAKWRAVNPLLAILACAISLQAIKA